MPKSLLLMIASFAAFCAEIVAAQDSIDIDVHTAMSPTKAIGIILTEHGAEQRPDPAISWKRVNSDTVVVTIPLGRGDRSAGTLVSALVMDDTGAVAFGNNKPADLPELSASIFSLPNCPGPKVSPSLETQGALLQSLLEVRTARRAKLQEQLNAALQGELLARLTKLERGFGMVHAEALSGTLPPRELQDRLARLVQAIGKYRAQRSNASAAAK